MYGLALGRAGAEQPNSIQKAAIGILRRYGSDAHVYLPGANGVAISGLSSGNYTLSDGSTGLSAIDGTAGLVLDAAGSVGAALTTLGTYVSVNAALTNGGVLPFVATSSAAGNYGGRVVGALVIGQWYRATLSWSGNTLNRSISADGGAGTVIGTEVAATKSYFFKCTAVSDHYFYAIGAAGAGETITFSSCTMEPVTGIHASQSTAGNRPVLRRGLYNLLTHSNDFTGWGKAGAPVVTASTVTRTVTGPTYVQGPAVTKAATAMPYSAIGKFTAGTGRYAAMRAQSTYPNFADAVFDLQNGTVYSSAVSGTFTGQVASIVKSANGECTCCVSFTTDAGTAVNAFASPNSNGVAIDGTDSSATSGFSSGGMAVAQGVWTAQSVLNEGGIPLTTSAAASNQSAGRYWHQYGGSHSLLTGNMGFTNAACITIAGKLDVLTGNHVLFGEAANGVQIYVTSAGAVVFDKNGVGAITATNTGEIVAGVPFVFSFLLRNGFAIIRKNGVQKANTATATVFSATTGARIGTDFAGANTCTGAIGQVIPINGVVSDADVLTNERQCASTFPASPSF